MVISLVLDMGDSGVHMVAGSDDERRYIRYAVARLEASPTLHGIWATTLTVFAMRNGPMKPACSSSSGTPIIIWPPAIPFTPSTRTVLPVGLVLLPIRTGLGISTR